jgi:hypothetical protein
MCEHLLDKKNNYCMRYIDFYMRLNMLHKVIVTMGPLSREGQAQAQRGSGTLCISI